MQMQKTLQRKVIPEAELQEAIRSDRGPIRRTAVFKRTKELEEKDVIYRIDRCHFSSLPRKNYSYSWDEIEKKLAKRLAAYEAPFALFDSNILNEWLNHLLSKDYFFLEVDKSMMDFVFDDLKEVGKRKILLQPTEKEFYRYGEDGTIVILPLFSRSPLQGNRLTIEKIMVDLVADKTLGWLFESSELEGIYEQILQAYRVNFSTLYSYAKRRRCQKELEEMIRPIWEECIK